LAGSTSSSPTRSPAKALTCRTPDGARATVRTLFGGIALLFCLRVLFVDILELI
jgi:hypothetical protein